MDWYPGLYIGTSLQRSKKKLKVQVEKRYPVAMCYYLLCLPQADHNQLEIYQAYQLWKPLFEGGSDCIVGIGSGYHEAMSLLQTIVAESFRAGFGANLRRFIEYRWREMRE